MLNDLTMPRRFFVAMYCVNFQKSHSGLYGEVRKLGLDPYNGDLVAFVNRNRTKIKILFGDNTGLTLIYKAFSKGTIKTQIDFLHNPFAKDVSYAEIAMLLEGNSYTVHKKSPKWLPKNLQ